MTLGARIIKFRTEIGFSQKKLSELIAIPQTTLSGYESDKSIPNALTLDKIAHVLNKNIEDMLCSESTNHEFDFINNDKSAHFPESLIVQIQLLIDSNKQKDKIIFDLKQEVAFLKK